MAMALPIDQQRFMAFEGLLTWIRAVVVQADRVSFAQRAIVTEIQRHPGEGVRALIHTFQAERHLFCVAAAKLFEHRKWITELDMLEPEIFAELDRFEADVRAMRNLNEHATEYFRGRGKFPADWDLQMSSFNSDPTGTQDSLIGGRLDWVALRATVINLMDSFPEWTIRHYFRE
jgi:hypothetical protein